MGFFSDIRDKIFKRHHEADATVSPVAPETPTAPLPPGAPASVAPQPTAVPASPQIPSDGGTQQPQVTAATTPAATAARSDVDVAAILDEAVRDSGQKLNWRTSIVDMMKALGLDSSLEARKELAKELGYTQDTHDSAAMNMWLHKQVLQKLAANGGKVPADLLD